MNNVDGIRIGVYKNVCNYSIILRVCLFFMVEFVSIICYLKKKSNLVIKLV